MPNPPNPPHHQAALADPFVFYQPPLPENARPLPQVPQDAAPTDNVRPASDVWLRGPGGWIGEPLRTYPLSVMYA